MNRPLLALLHAPIGLKIALLLSVAPEAQRFTTNDSVSYDRSALALLRAGRFDVSPDDPTPQTMRTPGYPALLAAVYAIAGHRPAAALTLQVLLFAATVWLAWDLARRRFGAGAALPAALLLSLDGASHLHSLLLLTETWFTFVLCLGLFCFVRLEHQHPRWAVGLLGAMLGATALVRPIAWPLVLVLPAVLLVLGKRGAVSRPLALLLAAGMLAAVLPWVARNTVVTGQPSLATIGRVDLVRFRLAQSVAYARNISLEQARWELGATDANAALRTNWTGGRLLAAFWRHADGLALTQLVGTAALFGSTAEHGLLRVAGFPGPNLGPAGALVRGGWGGLRQYAADHPQHLAVYAAMVTHLVLVYLLAGLALAATRHAATTSARRFDVIALTILSYFVLVSAGPETYHRFRVPLMPLLAVYAGAGWVTVHTALTALTVRARQRSSAALAGSRFPP